MTDNLITNTDTIFGGSQLEQALNQSLVQLNNRTPSIGKTLNLIDVNVVGSDPVLNQNFVTLQYANQHYTGGQGDNKPLNQINSEYPLTNNLDIRTSGFTIRGNDPIQPSDMAIKSWTEDQINNHYPNKIVAIGNAQNNVQVYQNGVTTFLQNQPKEVIQDGITTDYQPRKYNTDLQIIDENQLVTYKQTTAVIQPQIEEEKQARISADQNLQNQVNEIKSKPLNEWYVPMSNPLNNKTFEMAGNRITGMPSQLLNFTVQTDASSVQYVNDSVNQLATNVVGQIANVKTQCESYTDIQVGNLATDTELKLNQKMNANTTLNEIPLAISQLNMNYHRIENLAVPTGSSNPDLCAIPKGYADQRYLLQSTPLNQITQPTGELAMNNQQIKGLLAGTDANDAINFDQFQEYTTTIAPDTYRSRLSTLSDIQTEQPANLSMGNYRISCADPVSSQDVVTLEYFNTHGSGGGSADQISTGFTKVKCNSDETISLTANTDEIIRVEQTQVVINQPVFSTSSAPQNVSNAILTKSQLDPYYMNASTRLDQIPYPEGNVSMNGFQLRDLPLPTELHMATNKQYVDSQITDSVSKIQNGDQSAIVNANSDGTVSVKTNNATQTLVVSSLNNNYKIANNNNIEIQSNSVITLNPAQYTQFTTPVLSNSTAQTTQYQLLNRNQNDARYYQNTTTLNDIVAPAANINMAGFQLDNVSDALAPLQVPNLAQTESLIANSGFKNKIQSQSGHASIVCNQGSDTISIRANADDTSIDLSSTGLGTYTWATSGNLIYSAQQHNFNSNCMRIIGSAGLGSVLLAGDLRSTAQDLDLPDQILTRAQNDSRYLNATTTNLATIAPPDASVSFGGQLLRNLQTPILGTDASTKAYIDNTLTNYPTTAVLQANYLSKTDASNTYRTEQQVQSQIEANLQNYDTSLAVTDKINTALIPYSTSSQIASTYLTQANASSTYITPSQTDTKISNALVPYSTTTQIASTYLTQANASTTYQPQNTPFTNIVSTDQLNKVICNQGLNGIDFFASNAGVTNKICTISQPASYPQSCQIVSPSRLFLTSASGQFSIYSGTGQKNNSIYIGSSADNTAENNYDQIVIGNGRSTAPQLTLSSGHSSSNIPYSIICNTNTTALNNLQLSPEISANVLSGTALNMYSSTLVSSFPILCQFTQPTGRSSTQSTAQTNEFITKGYADAHYTGGSPSQISSTGSSVVCSNNKVSILANSTFTNPLDITKNNGYPGEVFQIDTTTAGSGILFACPNVYFGATTNVASYGTVVLPASSTLSYGQFAPTSNTQLLCKNNADFLYVPLNASISTLALPTGNFDFNTKLITNLGPGSVALGNTSSVTGGDVYSYINQFTGLLTQQTWTITLAGSSTTGITYANIPANVSTTYCQTQKVKGNGTDLLTSSTVGAVSTTLASSWATFELRMASNIRITQAWAYSTTAAGTGSQQNIASMTYSQQASTTAGRTNLQIYKPATSQGSDPFILYFTVDSF